MPESPSGIPSPTLMQPCEEMSALRIAEVIDGYAKAAARAVEADGRLAAAEEAGMAFLPFFPLANGLFTGKFTRTERPTGTRIADLRPHVADGADWDAMEAYQAFCDARGITMLDATIGWFLAKPVVGSVIAGATRP